MFQYFSICLKCKKKQLKTKILFDKKGSDFKAINLNSFSSKKEKVKGISFKKVKKRFKLRRLHGAIYLLSVNPWRPAHPLPRKNSVQKRLENEAFFLSVGAYPFCVIKVPPPPQKKKKFGGVPQKYFKIQFLEWPTSDP